MGGRSKPVPGRADTGLNSCWTMARKNKPKPFRAVKAVKAMARERIGTPRTSQVVPDRKKKSTEKHKPTLGKLLEEE